jgi:hypothetical protein
MWSESGRKNHFRLEFNAKALAERQTRDEIATTGRLSAKP